MIDAASAATDLLRMLARCIAAKWQRSMFKITALQCLQCRNAPLCAHNVEQAIKNKSASLIY
jgi:hypothetical protein